MKWLVEFEAEGERAGLRLFEYPGERLLGELSGNSLDGLAAGTPDPERLLAMAATLLDGESPADAREPPKASHSPNRRRKLWEIHSGFHCSIIGTCLTVDELRKLAPKVGVQNPGELTDYELHGLFVRHARDKGGLSLRLHKLLERKYAASVRRFGRIRDGAGVTALWHEASERGEIAGPYWAVMSHGAIEEQELWRVYGEVHMLSHQVGAANRADLHRLARSESLAGERQRRLDELRGQLAAERQRNRELEARLGESSLLEQRHAEAERRLAALEGDLELGRLRRRLEEAERGRDVEALGAARLREELRASGRAMELLQARNGELERDLVERSAERIALERHLERLLQPRCNGCEGPDGGFCSEADLAGRKVLCVGGRTGLAARYRALVENRNGEFLHHDGGLEESAGRLQGLLASADAVICPSDCVSHDAYYRVKGFCKRNGKPCLMLDGSGLSSFARALDHIVVDALPGMVTPVDVAGRR